MFGVSWSKPKIHIWGGLGSQLFGVALFFDLKKRFDNNVFSLVLHSSGVTQRYSELGLFHETIPMQFVDDYREFTIDRAKSKKSSLSSSAQKSFSRLLVFSRLIQTSNTNLEFKRVKFWTLMFRGHYSYRFISQETTQKILNSLSACGFEMLLRSDSRNRVLSIHYRLGDLLSLTSKGPIEADMLAKEVLRLCSERKFDVVYLYSDDLDEAMRRLFPLLNNSRIIAKKEDLWATLKTLINSDYFIGTNSKISIWVTIFRHYAGAGNQISLPNMLYSQISKNLGEENESHYY